VLSQQWGRYSLPFKGEGLAGWVQRTKQAKPIAFEALVYLCGGAYVSLARLLDNATWYADRSFSYAMAGTFTGYLIDRFGLDAYKTFYSAANERNFLSKFELVFGASLRDVERGWRDALLAVRDSYEPELGRAVGERRVERAYNRWELIFCIEQAEALALAGKATPRALWFAAWAHRLLRNFDDAADLLQRILHVDDVSLQAWRSAVWVELGQLNDLRDRREEALRAYEKALAEAEPGGESSRQDARQGMERPFLEPGD